MGWQDDDLPLFGYIEDILVIKNHVMFQVIKHASSVTQNYGLYFRYSGIRH